MFDNAWGRRGRICELYRCNTRRAAKVKFPAFCPWGAAVEELRGAKHLKRKMRIRAISSAGRLTEIKDETSHENVKIGRRGHDYPNRVSTRREVHSHGPRGSRGLVPESRRAEKSQTDLEENEAPWAHH